MEELAGKADADHTHKMADITDLSIDTSNLATKDELAGKADADHTHKMADITDLSIDTSNLATKEELAGKADVDHTHKLLNMEQGNYQTRIQPSSQLMKQTVTNGTIQTMIMPGNTYYIDSVNKKNLQIDTTAIQYTDGADYYKSGLSAKDMFIQNVKDNDIVEIFPNKITINNTPVSLEGHTHSEYALADHTHESLTMEKGNYQIKIQPSSQGIMVSYLNNGKIAGVALIRPGEIMTSNGAGTSSTQILENTISILDRSNNRNLRILPNQITINNDPVVLKSELDALEARVAALEAK